MTVTRRHRADLFRLVGSPLQEARKGLTDRPPSFLAEQLPPDDLATTKALNRQLVQASRLVVTRRKQLADAEANLRRLQGMVGHEG